MTTAPAVDWGLEDAIAEPAKKPGQAVDWGLYDPVDDGKSPAPAPTSRPAFAPAGPPETNTGTLTDAFGSQRNGPSVQQAAQRFTGADAQRDTSARGFPDRTGAYPTMPTNGLQAPAPPPSDEERRKQIIADNLAAGRPWDYPAMYDPTQTEAHRGTVGQNIGRGIEQAIAPLAAPFGQVGGEYAQSVKNQPPPQGIGGAIGSTIGTMGRQVGEMALGGPGLVFATEGSMAAGQSQAAGEDPLTAIARGTVAGGAAAVGTKLAVGSGGSIPATVAKQSAVGGGFAAADLVANKTIDVASGSKTPIQAWEELKQEAPEAIAQGAAVQNLLHMAFSAPGQARALVERYRAGKATPSEPVQSDRATAENPPTPPSGETAPPPDASQEAQSTPPATEAKPSGEIAVPAAAGESEAQKKPTAELAPGPAVVSKQPHEMTRAEWDTAMNPEVSSSANIDETRQAVDRNRAFVKAVRELTGGISINPLGESLTTARSAEIRREVIGGAIERGHRVPKEVLSDFGYAELRKIAKAAGLDPKGSKAQLVERLAGKTPSSPQAETTPQAGTDSGTSAAAVEAHRTPLEPRKTSDRSSDTGPAASSESSGPTATDQSEGVPASPDSIAAGEGKAATISPEASHEHLPQTEGGLETPANGPSKALRHKNGNPVRPSLEAIRKRVDEVADQTGGSAIDQINEILTVHNEEQYSREQYTLSRFALHPDDLDGLTKRQQRLIRNRVPISNDATSIREIVGDKLYEQAVEEALRGAVNDPVRNAKHIMSLGPMVSPQTYLDAVLSDHLRGNREYMKRGERGTMVMLDPAKLAEGDTFTIGGREFEVKRDATDGDLVIDSDLMEHSVPLAALEHGIPADGEPATAPPETTSVKADLFGKPFVEPATGTQQGLAFTEESALSKEAKGAARPDVEGQQRIGSSSALASPGHELLSPAMLKPTRIPPEPIATDKPKPISDILIDVGKGLGREVKAAQSSRGSIGTYYPGSTRTVIRFAGDLDTSAHELAHALDDQFGIVASWATPRGISKSGAKLPQKSPFDAELRKDIFQQTSSKRYSVVMKRAEGVAEWVRAYILNPAKAKAEAPKFHDFFMEKVPADVVAKIHAFSKDVREWAGSPDAEKILSNIQDVPRDRGIVPAVRAALDKSGQEFQTTALDHLSAVLIDDLAPLRKGIEAAKNLTGKTNLPPSKDPAIMSRLFAGFDDAFDDQLMHGPVNSRNERNPDIGGLSWLFEKMDQSSPKALEADRQATMALMVAERGVERARLLDDALRQVTALEAKAANLREEIRQLQPGEITDPDPRKELIDTTREISRIKKSVGYSGPSEKMLGFVHGKKQRMTGIGGGIFHDTQLAEKTIIDLRKNEPERYARLAESADRYRAWSNAMVLKPMLESGRISKEQYDAIKEKNQFYVAMQRVMEDVGLPVPSGASKRLGSARSVVQRFKGSTREIKNPYVSLIEQAYLAQKEARRNAAMVAFRDLLTTNRGMYQGDAENLASIGAKASAGDENTIPIYVHGKPEHWKFETGIHRALKGWGDFNPPVWFKIATLPQALLRSAVVHSPGFLIRNVIRDAISRGVISETGSKPWGIFHSISEKDLSKYRLAGGGQAGHYMHDPVSYYKELRRIVDETGKQGDGVIALPKQLGRGYLALSRGSEVVGRMAEFRKAFDVAKAKGMDDHNASLFAAAKARDLMDFAVAGRAMRFINRIVPFSNAAIQGLRRTARSAATDPAGFLARWTMYVVAPTIAAYALNSMRGQAVEDEHADLTAYQRDFFWNIRLSPGFWLRIPKPFEIGVMASGVERAIDMVRGKEDAFEGYAGNAAKSLLPMGEDALAGPFKSLVETITNHDFFTDRPIVSPYETDKPVADRKGAKTASRLGKAIAKAIPTDPRYVDQLIEGQLGELGRIATAASDLGRQDKPGGKRLLKSAVGLLAETPGPRSQLYKQIDKLEGLGSAATIEQKGQLKKFNKVRDAMAKVDKAIEAGTMDRADGEAFNKALAEWALGKRKDPPSLGKPKP